MPESNILNTDSNTELIIGSGATYVFTGTKSGTKSEGMSISKFSAIRISAINNGSTNAFTCGVIQLKPHTSATWITLDSETFATLAAGESTTAEYPSTGGDLCAHTIRAYFGCGTGATTSGNFYLEAIPREQ